MGAGDFHGRVRDGIGCGLPAMTTRSSSPSQSSVFSRRLSDGLGGGGSGVSVCAEPALGRLTRGLSAASALTSNFTSPNTRQTKRVKPSATNRAHTPPSMTLPEPGPVLTDRIIRLGIKVHR